MLAGETMNQAELDAYLGHVQGTATPQQEAIWEEWRQRNLPRFWAVWDERYPGWQNAPFWPKEPVEEDDGGDW